MDKGNCNWFLLLTPFWLLKTLDATCHCCDITEDRHVCPLHTITRWVSWNEFLQIKSDIGFINVWNLIYLFHEIAIPLPSYEAGRYTEWNSELLLHVIKTGFPFCSFMCFFHLLWPRPSPFSLWPMFTFGLFLLLSLNFRDISDVYPPPCPVTRWRNLISESITFPVFGVDGF